MSLYMAMYVYIYTQRLRLRRRREKVAAEFGLEKGTRYTPLSLCFLLLPSSQFIILYIDWIFFFQLTIFPELTNIKETIFF